MTKTIAFFIVILCAGASILAAVTFSWSIKLAAFCAMLWLPALTVIWDQIFTNTSNGKD